MISLDVIWKDFLKIIKEEAGSQVVETWFKAVTFHHWEPGNQIASFHMPNQFVQSWIKQHYSTLLKTHLSRLLHCNNILLSFSLETSASTPASSTQQNTTPVSLHHEETKRHDANIQKESLKLTSQNTYSIIPARPLTSPVQTPPLLHKKVPLKHLMPVIPSRVRNHARNNLNTTYQLENFIVGPSNSLAQAAAYAVSQSLGSVYNPLFIYGGTGLGKTHLLHAIGNEVVRKNPKAIVAYETSDRFMTEFINALRYDKSQQFRKKYRRLDLLLLDDVQFLANKEQTQETFFHIFNTLYEQQTQIVLSSDTYPKEITGLQNRLKSRMGWGLVVDIQMPDLETKIAILKKKSENHNLALSDEVASYIASRVLSNIRELEGSLIRVGAFASLTNQKITIGLAKRVLLHLPAEEKREGMLLSIILSTTAKHYHVSLNDIRSKKRHKNIVIARQAAFYLMKKLSYCSLQAIGTSIGGRDHSTVIHALNRVEERKKIDLIFAQKLKNIEQELRCS